jgi:hypothetical protein
VEALEVSGAAERRRGEGGDLGVDFRDLVV